MKKKLVIRKNGEPVKLKNINDHKLIANHEQTQRS